MQLHAKKFFVRCPWQEWWREFMADRRDDGRLKYLTSFEFAQAKAKDARELRLLYKAIGPKPVTLDAYKNKSRDAVFAEITYLGDWQQIRAKAYFYDNESLEKMKHVIAERMDTIEAGRGAATLVLDLLAKWIRYDDSIDEAFASTPMVAGLNPMVQQKRADLFFRMKNQTLDGTARLIEKYLACHGINTDGVTDLAHLIVAAGKSASAAALTGVAAGAAIEESAAARMLSRAIIEKDKIFKLGMPTAIAGDKMGMNGNGHANGNGNSSGHHEDEEQEVEVRPMRRVRDSGTHD